MPDIFVGRQPIYDRDSRVLAYELLFRHADEHEAVFSDGDAATSEVMQSAFVDLGLERIVGSKLAFINLTRNLLTSGAALVLPHNRVVLELLEEIEIDETVIEAVGVLTEQGYRIALDDYIFQEGHEPLLELACYVKIDLERLSLTQVREQVHRLRAFGAKLLAEKVATRAQYAACRAMGFDYFQGCYLGRPNVVHGRRIPTNRLAVLRLLKKLHDPGVRLQELETYIGANASLSYQLLRFVNSAYYGLGQPLESIHRAVVYLGLEAIRRWVTLITLRDLESDGTDLLLTALVRARMCQMLAEEAGLGDADVFFTVGLLSNLDHILQVPMAEILADLPLRSDVNQALLARQGAMGEALVVALAFEADSAGRVRRFHGLDQVRTGAAYLEAVAWAYDLKQEVSG